MDDRFYVEFTEMEEDETTQWFWDFRRQVLFSNDKQSGTLKYLMSLSKKDNEQYNRIIKYHNKIIGIPVRADNILMYDIVTKTIDKMYLPIGVWNEDAQKKGKFGRGIIYGNYLIFLPAWSNIICKIDVKQKCIVSVKDISDAGINTNSTIPFSQSILDMEYIYMTVGEEPALIIINAQTLTYTKKEFNHYEKGFCAIIKQKDYYWLFPRYRGEIIKWNPKTDKEERYSLPENLMPLPDRIGFNSVQSIGDYFWLFPVAAPEVVKIDAKTGSMEAAKALKKYSSYKKDSDNFTKYWMTKTEGIFLKFYSVIQGVLVQYDTEKNSIKELPFYLSGEDKNRYFLEVEYTPNCILNENMVSLSNYLNIIERRNLLSMRNEKETVGNEIHQKIINY